MRNISHYTAIQRPVYKFDGFAAPRRRASLERRLAQDRNQSLEQPAARQQQQHVMISYQWESQELMLRVRDDLKAAGYDVWMDVDKMC